MQVNLTGDEAGPPRLARYLAARKEERERLKVLAEAGATDPLLYETPGARAPLVLRRCSNALRPVIGLRAQALSRAQVRARCRRSSTSSEEGLPIRVAFQRRWREAGKRGRGSESSGRVEEQEECASGESTQQTATSTADATAVHRAGSAADGSIPTVIVAAAARNTKRISISDALAAARAAALAAKKKRVAFVAGKQHAMEPVSAPDKHASTTMRQRIQTIHQAWDRFLEEQPEGWLGASEAPDFEKTWQFVRDELINSRRTRSLRVEGLEGGLEQSVHTYVNTMRDWLWPELFPSLTTRAGGMSVGEWRSFWSRLKNRVHGTFTDGGSLAFGRSVAEQGAEEATGYTNAAQSAGREAASHRRKQTLTPSTRNHASSADLYLAQG